MFPPLLLIIALFLVVFGVGSENPIFKHGAVAVVVILVAMLVIG